MAMRGRAKPQGDAAAAGGSSAPETDAAGRRVCVGAIAGAFGVRGEARLKTFTETPEAIAAYGPLETEDGARRFEIVGLRPIKGGVAARLRGLETREAVEALKGARLYVERAALPRLEDADEFYHADLVGMSVVDLDGRPLGEVRSVQNYGAGDFLEIVAPDLKRPALLPFTREAAPRIELTAGRIFVDPPAGVFGDDPAEPEPRSSEDGSERGAAEETGGVDPDETP